MRADPLTVAPARDPAGEQTDLGFEEHRLGRRGQQRQHLGDLVRCADLVEEGDEQVRSTAS